MENPVAPEQFRVLPGLGGIVVVVDDTVVVVVVVVMVVVVGPPGNDSHGSRSLSLSSPAMSPYSGKYRSNQSFASL